MPPSSGSSPSPGSKTSLAPGSRVVTDYLTKAGLLGPLESIGFNVVGYGCTTCTRQLRPLKPEISAGIKAGDIVATSVLSGNRNFEGRVHPGVEDELPRFAAARGRAMRSPARWTSICRPKCSATVPMANRWCSPTSGPPTRKWPMRCTPTLDFGHVPQELRQRLHGRSQLAGHQDSARQDLRLEGRVHLRAQSAATSKA